MLYQFSWHRYEKSDNQILGASIGGCSFISMLLSRSLLSFSKNMYMRGRIWCSMYKITNGGLNSLPIVHYMYVHLGELMGHKLYRYIFMGEIHWLKHWIRYLGSGVNIAIYVHVRRGRHWWQCINKKSMESNLMKWVWIYWPSFFLFAAKFMEEDQKHCPLVTLYSTIQEKQVSLDTVSWPPR